MVNSYTFEEYFTKYFSVFAEYDWRYNQEEIMDILKHKIAIAMLSSGMDHNLCKSTELHLRGNQTKEIK